MSGDFLLIETEINQSVLTFVLINEAELNDYCANGMGGNSLEQW